MLPADLPGHKVTQKAEAKKKGVHVSPKVRDWDGTWQGSSLLAAKSETVRALEKTLHVPSHLP